MVLSPTATDPDGDALTFTYSGWMDSNSYTTNSDDIGAHLATVTVTDGSLNDSQEVTILVNQFDIIPPAIKAVSVNSTATQVMVVFSEPVEETIATNLLNYNIDNAIVILTASISSDLKTVTLATGQHVEGTYTLTVNNIQDLANIPNVINPNTTVSYAFTDRIEITNLTVDSGKIYETAYDSLQKDATAYIDQNDTFVSIPTWLEGATYIKTANNDRKSKSSSFLSFNVNIDATIYVAHDDNINIKPLWLTSFTDTGDDIITTAATLSIYESIFPAGTVRLGGNEGRKNHNMYTIIIEKK